MSETLKFDEAFGDLKTIPIIEKKCDKCMLYPGCIVIKNELKMAHETNQVTNFFDNQEIVNYMHGLAVICNAYKYLGDYMVGEK